MLCIFTATSRSNAQVIARSINLERRSEEKVTTLFRVARTHSDSTLRFLEDLGLWQTILKCDMKKKDPSILLYFFFRDGSPPKTPSFVLISNITSSFRSFNTCWNCRQGDGVGGDISGMLHFERLVRLFLRAACPTRTLRRAPTTPLLRTHSNRLPMLQRH